MWFLFYLYRFCFASGADEKIARVFQAPRNFLENFGRLCLANVDDELKRTVRLSLCIYIILAIGQCLTAGIRDC